MFSNIFCNVFLKPIFQKLNSNQTTNIHYKAKYHIRLVWSLKFNHLGYTFYGYISIFEVASDDFISFDQTWEKKIYT